MARNIKSNKVERIQYDVKKDFNTGVVTDFCIINPEAIKIKNRTSNKTGRKFNTGKVFTSEMKGGVL